MISILPALSFVFQIASCSRLMIEPPGFEGNAIPVSSRDRIYTGDQASNTITVIDPGQNKVLGTWSLGDERLMNDLGPQYVESVNSHGLGFSRDGKYIVSMSITTNTITVIRTSDNALVSKTYVDRAPHEAFFAPDNRTVWIGTRGVSSVDIIDGLNGTFIDRIFTAAGPSKVLFSGNGTIAYVNHIFDAIISVIDVPSRTVMYNITGLASSFSSDMMISADSQSLWAAHKLTGQVSVIDLAARKVLTILETGPETNHPNFAIIDGVNHAFVTVAALNATKVYRQPQANDLPILVKTIMNTGIQPHPVWPSPDNTRIYVANQHSDTVDVIDTSTLEIIDTMKIGQDTQSLIYLSNVVPEGSNGTENLGTQGLGLRVENRLIPVASNSNHNLTAVEPHPLDGKPQAIITIRQTAGSDMFQVIGRNLIPNGTYTASATCISCGHDGRMPLVTFNASDSSPTGCGEANEVLAFFKFFDVYDLDSLWIQEGM